MVLSEIVRSKQHVLVVNGALASSERLQLIVRVPLWQDSGAEVTVEQGPRSHRFTAAQWDPGGRGVRERVVGTRGRLDLTRRRVVVRLGAGPGCGHTAAGG